MANTDRKPSKMLASRCEATPVKSNGAGVVETAIGAGSLRAAGAGAGEVAVLRGK